MSDISTSLSRQAGVLLSSNQSIDTTHRHVLEKLQARDKNALVTASQLDDTLRSLIVYFPLDTVEGAEYINFLMNAFPTKSDDFGNYFLEYYTGWLLEKGAPSVSVDVIALPESVISAYRQENAVDRNGVINYYLGGFGSSVVLFIFGFGMVYQWLYGRTSDVLAEALQNALSSKHTAPQNETSSHTTMQSMFASPSPAVPSSHLGTSITTMSSTTTVPPSQEKKAVQEHNKDQKSPFLARKPDSLSSFPEFDSFPRTPYQPPRSQRVTGYHQATPPVSDDPLYVRQPQTGNMVSPLDTSQNQPATPSVLFASAVSFPQLPHSSAASSSASAPSVSPNQTPQRPSKPAFQSPFHPVLSSSSSAFSLAQLFATSSAQQAPSSNAFQTPSLSAKKNPLSTTSSSSFSVSPFQQQPYMSPFQTKVTEENDCPISPFQTQQHTPSSSQVENENNRSISPFQPTNNVSPFQQRVETTFILTIPPQQNGSAAPQDYFSNQLLLGNGTPNTAALSTTPSHQQNFVSPFQGTNLHRFMTPTTQSTPPMISPMQNSK